MRYNFDEEINRQNTNSLKWDCNELLFGSREVLPLWVADMDFKVPQPVIDAVQRVAEFGIYGYSHPGEAYYQAVAGWMNRRHGWEISPDWVVFSPGVVPALHMVIRTFTVPGDKVLLQSPVYHPFFKVAESNGCEVVNSPLKLAAGKMEIDFTDLEAKISSGVKLFLFCSPHNPGGRVWEREELRRVSELCLKYDVLMVSDEIHMDLVFKPYKHMPLALAAPEVAQNCIVCTAPSKTFNLAGLQISNLIIPNPKLRRAFSKTAQAEGLTHPNIFGMAALEAAYRDGEAWLDQLLEYIAGNLEFLVEYVETHLPHIKVIKPQGTYLAWLDFRALGLAPEQIGKFLCREAKVALSDGYIFGPGGEGFERINLACPRSLLAEALRRLTTALT